MLGSKLNYAALSSNVLINPAILWPPDCSAEITFLAGDCRRPIISPTNSSLDLSVANVFNWSSPSNIALSM